MNESPFPESPITIDLLLSGAVGINEVVTDGADVYWVENRPDEGGRGAVMRWRNGTITEIAGPTVNVRTRVHEYGGGAWWVDGGRLIYSDDASAGELFLLAIETGELSQLTSSGYRYSDGRFTPDGQGFICVRERHGGSEGDEVVNEVVVVSLDGSREQPIFGGHDFFASPRISCDGRVACVAWDHPNMSWDETIVLAADSIDSDPRVLVQADEVHRGLQSTVLADFADDGRLFAVSDHSNWWNLVEIDWETGETLPVTTGEHELATPGWVFGLGRWADTEAGIAYVAGQPAGDEIHFPNGYVESRHTTVSSLRAYGSGVAYVAASFREEAAVWIHDGSHATRISNPRDLRIDVALLPTPELLTFDVEPVAGDRIKNPVAHALFYEPATVEPRDGLPPLLVLVHGGPTGAARRQLNLSIRCWTSREVAVADVDYRVSTLYGRDYRHSLRGGWGVTDVIDCVAAARYLADSGRVDPSRMVIEGGSAGGLTVLNAVAHHDVFSGGISRYGVAELGMLAEETHKFEARYLDRLVGDWPEDKATYDERSPLTHADKISVPMLILQGDEDMIVPQSQSDAIVAALDANDIPVSYHVYEGEGHGFRKAETMAHVLEAEEAFIASL